MNARIVRRLIVPLSSCALLVSACAEPDESELPSVDTAPRAVEVGPVTRGWRAATEGDHEAAMEAYREATEQDPERAEAWIGLAREALRTEQIEPAREAASRAVELAPESADAHELAGRAALEAGDHAAAVERLGRALELDPERARLHFPLGRALEGADQRSGAIEAYHASAEAGVLAARALVAAARLEIDERGPVRADEADDEAASEETDPFRAAVADLDRAEERAAEGDDAVRRWIIAQRRRIDEKRREGEVVDRHAQDLAVAQNAGLLAVLGQTGSLNNVFGNAGIDDALAGGMGGGLIGADDRGFGSGGLGMRGTGGGGGSGLGTTGGLGGLRSRAAEGPAEGIGRLQGAGSGGSASGERPRPNVSIGAVTATGLSASHAQQVVRRRSMVFRYCYERELMSDPALAGDVTLTATVGDAGDVTAARVASSTLGSSRVEGCLVRMARRMRFEAPSGDSAEVTIPISFSAE